MWRTRESSIGASTAIVRVLGVVLEGGLCRISGGVRARCVGNEGVRARCVVINDGMVRMGLAMMEGMVAMSCDEMMVMKMIVDMGT